MKVFVVMFNEYYRHEYDTTVLREVFLSMDEAELYVSENSSEIIKLGFQEHYFEIIEKEVK